MEVELWTGQCSLYDTLGPEGFRHILELTEGTTLFSTQSLSQRVPEEMERNKFSIRDVIFFDPVGQEEKEQLESLGVKVVQFSELLTYQKEAERPEISPDQHLTYVFTSGTTGIPKGVVNTHRMVIAVGSRRGGALCVSAH